MTELAAAIWDWVRTNMAPILGTMLTTLVLVYFRKIVGLIKAALEFLLDAALSALSKLLSHQLSARVSAKVYAAHILSGNSARVTVPVSGAHQLSLSLDEIYVPIRVDTGTNSRRIADASSLTVEHPRLVIVGEPGSGKSTLTKKMVRQAAISLRRRPNKSPLPILIELRRLRPPASDDDSDLLKWILLEIEKAAGASPAFGADRLFKSFAQRTGVLILLDGFDEVAGKHAKAILASIQLLASELDRLGSKNAMIATTRPAFFEQYRDDLLEWNPAVATIEPFSSSDVLEFLLRWPFPGHDPRSRAIRTYEDLATRPTLKEMVGNPLILSMYVARFHTETEGLVLPDTRTEFYSQVVEELLVTRRWRQAEQSTARLAVREQRYEILGRIAYRHLLNSAQSANSISLRGAIEVVREVTALPTDQAAEDFLNELAVQTGLFASERLGESIRFTHLTFCEFLAAYEAVRGKEGSWDQLINTCSRQMSTEGLNRGRLTEVIPFSYGLQLARDRVRSMTAIVRLRDWSMSARAALEGQSYDNPEWLDAYHQEVADILGTSTRSWDLSWTRRVQLLIVVVRQWNACFGSTGASSPTTTLPNLFRDLIGNDSHRLAKLFSSMATQDPAAALVVVSEIGFDIVNTAPRLVVENLVDPTFLALALDDAMHDEANASAWACALAEACLEYPGMTALLPSLEIAAWKPTLTEVRYFRRWRGLSQSPDLYRDALTVTLNQALKPDPLIYPILETLYRARPIPFEPPLISVATVLLGGIGFSRFSEVFGAAGMILLPTYCLLVGTAPFVQLRLRRSREFLPGVRDMVLNHSMSRRPELSRRAFSMLEAPANVRAGILRRDITAAKQCRRTRSKAKAVAELHSIGYLKDDDLWASP